MIAQFRTADDAIWMIDTETLQWANISLPANDPESKVISEGVLTNLNYGRFAMTPRTEKSEAPGAGLCCISLMPLVHAEQLLFCLSVNVASKDFTMPVPVKEIIYEIISEKVAPAVQQVDDSQESRAGESVAELESLPVPLVMVTPEEYAVDGDGLDPENIMVDADGLDVESL